MNDKEFEFALETQKRDKDGNMQYKLISLYNTYQEAIKGFEEHLFIPHDGKLTLSADADGFRAGGLAWEA